MVLLLLGCCLESRPCWLPAEGRGRSHASACCRRCLALHPVRHLGMGIAPSIPTPHPPRPPLAATAVSRTLLPSPNKKKAAGGSSGGHQKAAKGKAPAARKAAAKAAKA